MKTILSTCDCGAVLYTDNDLVNSCGEPCRFAMMKEGEGTPPLRSRDYYEGMNDGIEAAAKAVLGGHFLHDQAPAKRFADEVAPVIRALKVALT